MCLYSKESEKEKLEKEFNDRLTSFREELEKNEEEKASLHEQLELLKQQQGLNASESTSNLSLMESDAYNVMQSVGPGALDIANRVVIGEETDGYYVLHDQDEILNGHVCGNRSSTPNTKHEVDRLSGTFDDDSALQSSSKESFVNILSETEKENSGDLSTQLRFVLSLLFTVKIFACS